MEENAPIASIDKFIQKAGKSNFIMHPFCSTAGQACAAYVNAQLLSKAKKIVLLEIVTQPDEER